MEPRNGVRGLDGGQPRLRKTLGRHSGSSETSQPFLTSLWESQLSTKFCFQEVCTERKMGSPVAEDHKTTAPGLSNEREGTHLGLAQNLPCTALLKKKDITGPEK